MVPRVALVTSDFSRSFGVGTLTRFLYQVLSDSGKYQPEIISLATSARDDCSVRMLSPATWFRGPQIRTKEWKGLSYRHVGAWLTEVELQRYQPRSLLARELESYDIVQVIAGSPAWAHVAAGVKRPVALQVATLAAVERVSSLRSGSRWKRCWAQVMTRKVTELESRALASPECVFVMNPWMLDHLTRLLGSDRVLMAVPGVDTRLFSPRSGKSGGYMIAVGRFWDPRKNVRLLFEAYARVSGGSAAAPTLCLVGAAPADADMRYAAELGIADRVQLHQDVSKERLAELYRGADFLVLSSDEEGLGLVILEAMASGLPVVCTDCGGPTTTVVPGETGYLTPVGDADALAEAMQRLIGDSSLRERMGQAARQTAEERFSLSVTGKVYMDRYEELLGRPRPVAEHQLAQACATGVGH